MFVDGPNLLDVPLREVHVRARLALTENEVRAVFLEVATFREANALVLCVVFEASRFERHRGAGVRIAAFAVAGRSGTAIAVPTLCEPAVERFSEFFELTIQNQFRVEPTNKPYIDDIIVSNRDDIEHTFIVQVITTSGSTDHWLRLSEPSPP